MRYASLISIFGLVYVSILNIVSWRRPYEVSWEPEAKIETCHVPSEVDRNLDNLLTRDKISKLFQMCPKEQRLRVESFMTYDDFVQDLFKTINASVHEPFLKPIEEILPFFNDASKSDQFLVNGFWAEFGVFRGNTLKFATDTLLQEPMVSRVFKGPFAGFDSFEGLPEDWRERFPKGTFRDGDVYNFVRNRLPPEVELYKGWFQDTITQFKANHPNIPAAFIHHDGDLFLSTTITFQLLSDRIVPGTHMIFDELLGYKGYEKHELLALYLWMVDHKVLLCSKGHKGYIDIKHYSQPEKEVHQTEQSVWFQVLEMQ